jgi:CDP-diacylglycerol--glycerol-3-phosphate 3-phosphatidyltransferase
MLDGRWRSTFEKGFKPIGTSLRSAGLSADHLTLLGIVAAVASAVAIANGALRGGLLLLLAAGACDALDGSVAKASGGGTTRGTYFDSVSDRLTDAILFGGVAWYLSGDPGGRVALLPMAVMAAAMLVSYQRAKADALGFDARGGFMERAERFVFLGFGLLFDSLLVPVLWFMLLASTVTAAQRFAKVWAQASEPMRTAQRPRRRPPRSARRPSRASSGRTMSATTAAWRDRARARRDQAS